MFSKHVWYDRTHQAELFVTEEGIVSGAIISVSGTLSIINPRPEILTALYQEAKIRRILSLKTVILTDNTVDLARGLCSLVSYSRGLRRRTPLTVITRQDARISSGILNTCCAHLLHDSAFDLKITSIAIGAEIVAGKARVKFVRGGLENPYLVIESEGRMLHYFDESHRSPQEQTSLPEREQPTVTISAGDVPGFVRRRQRLLNVLH